MGVHGARAAFVAAFLGIAAGLPVAAQTPAPPIAGGGKPAPAQKSAAGMIAGTVTSDHDGAPLARARVLLHAATLSYPRVTISDARGNYAFPGLPSGDYELLVVRGGYALAGTGPRRGIAVRLGNGETRAGLDLALQRAGTIPGRLLDEDGSPLSGADIEALSLRASDGQPALAPAASTRTDDRGDFRLSGLAAGQYFIVARDPAFTLAGDEGGPLRYAPTYFPGVLSSAEAQPVSVSAGAEATRLEFRIRIVKPARVSGMMRAPDQRPLLSGAVILVRRDGSHVESLPLEDVEIRPDGAFAFRNVLPGTYQLRARGAVDPQQVMLFGSFAFTVAENRDVDGISIRLAPGAVVEGRIEWMPSRPRPREVRGLRVRAPFADTTSFGDALTGDVAADGSFRLRGVMTGAHHFAVDGLPPPWTISAVLVRGRDVLEEPLNLHEGEQLANVRLVVSPTAPELAGTVRDSKGRPAADALIVAMPPGTRLWSAGSARFRSTRTDKDGRYRVHGLLPGSYRVAALVAVDELAAHWPPWLERIDGHATAIALAATDTRTLDLVALHADALPPLVAR